MNLFLLLPFLLNVGDVYIGELSDVISPASSAYILRTIERAERDSALCLIIKLDTPGGLDESMREITKRILVANIPIVIYIAPKGARAASAGTFILYSSHIAAMAPGTNVGAAHPVGISGKEVDSVMARKVTNDAASYITALAKERKRNVKWAEKAVRECASIDAETALKLGVCEIIAQDIDDLITKLDGYVVKVKNKKIKLRTKDRPVKKLNLSFRERFLLVLTNPNIAYILLLLGIYGLFFELQNPGMIFPGMVGGICLILGFYALQLLPVNYAGVALIILSGILFVLEIYITSHGLLTIGGIISLVFGSLILFQADVPYLRVSWEVIMIAVIVIAGFVIFLLALGIHAQFRKPVTGKRGIVGELGIAKTDVKNRGTVLVRGEFWNARSDELIKEGSKIEVVGVDGMILNVKSIDTN